MGAEVPSQVRQGWGLAGDQVRICLWHSVRVCRPPRVAEYGFRLVAGQLIVSGARELRLSWGVVQELVRQLVELESLGEPLASVHHDLCLFLVLLDI